MTLRNLLSACQDSPHCAVFADRLACVLNIALDGAVFQLPTPRQPHINIAWLCYCDRLSAG
jgi:hypothetical protein